MRAVKKIKRFMFNIHEAVWWVVAEIEDWLYPYHDRLTPEDKFEIRVKDPILGEKLSAWVMKKKACRFCCCELHCSLAVIHGSLESYYHFNHEEVIFNNMLDRSWFDDEEYEEYLKIQQQFNDPVLNLRGWTFWF